MFLCLFLFENNLISIYYFYMHKTAAITTQLNSTQNDISIRCYDFNSHVLMHTLCTFVILDSLHVSVFLFYCWFSGATTMIMIIIIINIVTIIHCLLSSQRDLFLTVHVSYYKDLEHSIIINFVHSLFPSCCRCHSLIRCNQFGLLLHFLFYFCSHFFFNESLSSI